MASEYRQFAQQVLDAEAYAIRQLALDDRFDQAVRLILDCPGAVLTSGIGKAGHVARKLSASFSSTGTPSHYLNPAEAVHGDLGSVRRGDVVVILSYSGESDEIVRVLSVLKKLGTPVIAVTATAANSLGRFSDVVLELGRIEEACPLRLAPSASTTAMLALGDALCLTVMRSRNFTADDFALYHPAGQLGRKLIKVREAMGFKKGENLPVASDRLTVGQVLHEVSQIKRRSGAVILVDEHGRLSGIFSDGDLRRLLTDDDGSALRRPIREVMTRDPKRIHGDKLASEAIAVMRPHRIDDLPVASDQLTVGQVLREVSSLKRRSGAVVLVDEKGTLSGIFSDGDLRRLLTDADADGDTGAGGSGLRRPVRDVMTRNPKRIGGDRLASEAIAVMRPHRIDDLPVVDDDGRPIGLIDIQDLVVLKMMDVEP